MGFDVKNILLIFTLVLFTNVNSETISATENFNLNELKQQLDHLQLDFEVKISELMKELEKERFLKEAVAKKRQELLNKISKLDTAYSRPSARLDNAAFLTKTLMEDANASPRNIAPSSCLDLQRIGHSFDSIHMVANKGTTKIEAYFCDFGTTLVPQLIGHVDVKSGERSAHFYAQALPAPGIVRYERPTLNEGDVLDPLQGIFTAPVNGTYHFAFHFVQEETPDPLIIKLQMNNQDVGQASSNIAFTGFFFNTFTISMSASLYMVSGDTVNLLATGIIHPGPNNHFTGWLVEEDIIVQ